MLKAIDLNDEYAKGIIRVSLGKYNTSEDVEKIVRGLEKIIKDPYVLEFLDLLQNEHFYESELEQALIDHLQKFLLELGRGFSFVARQKHFNIDGRHFLPSDAQKVSYQRRP